MKKIKSLIGLFFAMLKIGAFTFGGGYAMISLLDNEFVTRRGWLAQDEFLDLVAIAESTPGPIAINCSTYIGYRREGFLGATIATLGMCLPSLIIIFIISLFFDKFLEIKWVSAAFRGIQACVVYLILAAGFKMLRKMKKNAFSLTAYTLTFISLVVLSLCAVKFSAIFYILIFGSVGALIFAVRYMKDKGAGGKEK